MKNLLYGCVRVISTVLVTVLISAAFGSLATWTINSILISNHASFYVEWWQASLEIFLLLIVINDDE